MAPLQCHPQPVLNYLYRWEDLGLGGPIHVSVGLNGAGPINISLVANPH